MVFCNMILCSSVGTSVTEKTAAPLLTVQLYQKYDFKLQQKKVKAVCGSYSTAALKLILLLP